MHISEGVLSASVLVSGWGVTSCGTIFALRKMKNEDIPKVALMSSAFFMASLIHIPFGITSVHLMLNGLLGILLGWAAFPAILIALLMQAILFQYGGLSSLGVNTMVMALPALIVYGVFQKIMNIDLFKTSDSYISGKAPVKFLKRNLSSIAGFLCGSFSIVLSALLLSLALYFSGDEFLLAAKLAVVAHIPVMIIEGFVTAFCVVFLEKVKPDALKVKSKT